MCATRSGTPSFDPGSPETGTWIANPTWSIPQDGTFDGVAGNCYATFIPDPVNDKVRLIQGFVAPVATGTYGVGYDYVYEDGNANDGDPYFWVLGVNSTDPPISRFPLGGDGFPENGAPADISNWDVLYQRKLAGSCPLTDCADGPALPVGSAGNPVMVSDSFHVAAAYDYWVAVVSYGCRSGSQDCTTLRGLDNVSIEVLDPDEEGPYTKHVAGVPNAQVFGTPFAVTATIDDTETGNSNIAGAAYTIDGSLPAPMDAADGAFDSPVEDVTAIAGGLPVGRYEICASGTDAGGNVGEETCSGFVTYSPISESGLNIPVSNECAQFYTLENPGAENEITTLHYGETIVFDTRFHLNGNLNISDSGNVNFKFHTQAHGQGNGVTSGIQYQFMLNSMLKTNTSLVDFDPFTGAFDVKARIVGQAQEIDGYGILNGAQNNAELLFKLRIHYANGYIQHEAYDFSIECAGDPWNNLMENKDLETRQPVGRGFGDEQNKYGWTGIEYKNALIVGTKNAFYDLATYVGGDGGPITSCINNPPDPSFPEIYWRFACMEIFGFGNPNIRDSNGAQLWRFDYRNKRWQLAYDAVPRVVPEGVGPEFVQGFRDSVVHEGKLYVAADLGAFISGVSYENMFKYPGVALLVSADGINFEIVEGCPTGSGDLCQSQTVPPPGLPTNNLSIRALASYDGKLFIGTLNNTGGQIWTYDGSVFTKVWPAGPMPNIPLIGELEPHDGKLYIGVGGVLETQDNPNNNYIYVCDVCDGSDTVPLANLPNIDPNTFFVIKLFSGQGKLFAGTVNFENGTSFLSYDSDGGVFDVIVDDAPDGGFFDRFNIYLWSMAELDGRLFAGTFNPVTITEIPRGTAELWYSDDGANWFQYPMPIGWSLLGYGIRDLVSCDNGKALCLLSATNMVAPDLVDFENPLSAGLEVWTIRDTKIVKPSGGRRGKNKP
jgi:hypothetical protein